MSLISYAQNFEDVMLWRALKHIEHGFYVDVGAQHPVVDSVSKAFYEHGWRGMHIEPVPEYADLLRNDRPDETVLQLALSDKEGTLELNVLPDTGLSTFNDAYAQKHQKEHGFNVHRVKVATLTLNQALQEHTGKDIHWLKIDVEGHEAQVLKGWNSKLIRPWIILVEATVPLSQTKDYQTWDQYLTKARYKFVYFDGLNRFYVATEHSDLVEHFKSPPNVFDGFVLNGTANSSLCQKILAEKDDNAKIAAAAREQINSIEAKSQWLQNEWDAAQQKIVTLSQQNSGMENVLVTLRKQSLIYEPELNAAQGQINTYEAKFNWLQSEFDTAQQKVAALSHQTGALETEQETQRKQSAHHEHELTAAREQVKALEAKSQWLQNEWDSAQHKVTTLSHQTGALETELAAQRVQSAHHKHEQTTAREQIYALELKTQWLQSERDDALQKLGKLIHQNDTLATELANQCEQAAQYDQKLAVAHEMINTLEINTGLQQIELDTASTKVEELNRSSHHWWAVADGLKLEFTAAREQVRSLEAKTEWLQNELNAAKAKVDELNHSSHHWWSVAEGLKLELKRVYASKSWKITLPLRKTVLAAKWLLALPARTVRWALRQPKRIAKPLVVWGMRMAITNPGMKAQTLNVLNRHPKLKHHLHLLAIRSGLIANRSEAMTFTSRPVAVISEKTAPPLNMQTIMQPESPSSLSPRAARIYAKLMRTVEARKS